MDGVRFRGDYAALVRIPQVGKVIYFTTPDQKHVIILDPERLDKIRAGEPVASPDSFVIVAYCPDANWMRERLLEVFNGPGRTLAPAKLDELLAEGMKQPEVR